MKVYAAQIVDEPENAPVLLLATSEADLLVKLKAELSWLDGVDDCKDADEVSELYEEYTQDRGEMYAGVFTEEQDL